MKIHLPVNLAAVLLLLTSVGLSRLAAEVFVAPDGNDANAGTLEKPFATLAHACDVLRGKNSTTKKIIQLRGGDYTLPQTLELTAADSGLIIRSADDEKVAVSGGRTLRPKDFQPVTDAATLARIAPGARGNIVELDLAALGIKHRQPYPNIFNDSGNLVELYFNGARMPLSRFPNGGYMTMKRVLNNAGGVTNKNWENASWEKVDPNDTGGTFVFRDEFFPQHANWAKVLDRGVWLKGYWRIPWENEAIRVASIDTNAKTVTFTKPIPGGIGSKYQRPEGSGQEKYWLMNLLEEIDQPGEWAVDFPSGKLYFYPPGKMDGAKIVLCDNDQPIIRITGATNVVLRQLTVENNLGHGIEIDGGESNLIAGCTVRNVSRYAVKIDGGFHHEVLSCDLYDLGAGGVWLGGGDEKSSPHVPAGHRVVNNHIHDFAQIERVYAPGVNCGFTGGGGGGHHAAVGMYVAHNLIHDTPHVGILHGSFDSIFEFNEILEFCKVSNDMGAWYCYDQFARMGNQTFRYNFIHSSNEGDGVYFDNDHPDMHVYGNVVCLDSKGKRGTAFLYKRGTQAKFPQAIDCTNNIAINCNYGFEIVTALPSRVNNNVTVNCQHPFTWKIVSGTNIINTNALLVAGQKNVSYPSDPGFVNFAKHDFRLKPDAQVFKDLPDFQPIPFEKIGLFTDEFRKQLPTDEEAGRTENNFNSDALGVDIQDRK
jgi:parallel beta-helix repeat protein